jgi:hypothetical protein
MRVHLKEYTGQVSDASAQKRIFFDTAIYLAMVGRKVSGKASCTITQELIIQGKVRQTTKKM